MAAKLPDINLLIQAGFDPKTGLPLKFGIGSESGLVNDIRMQLRILDEQNAINRYNWVNLPEGLNSNLMERILYYKGQGAFFYMKELNKFFFLPYALDGTIDVYGRFMSITPLPFNGQSNTDAKGKIKPWIQGLTKKPLYDVPQELTEEQFLDGCVILKDYTQQFSETIIARQIIQDPLLNVMAETIPLARTALIASSGVRGVRVQDEDQKEEVKIAACNIKDSAIRGDIWIPITAQTEFQELTNGTALRSEEFLIYLQALDNYRLSLYGLDTGGLFQKKSHMLEAEQEMNAGHAKLAYQDGLSMRQRFCDIVNSIWGLGIWCEPSESVLAMDMNGDGIAADTQGESNQVEESEGEENEM